MKKLSKILLIITTVIIVLVIALTIVIKIAFPPEKVKEILIREAEKNLGREVKIQELSLGILKGIKVKGFALSEAPDFKNGTFVESEEFLVGFRLLPLLKKRLEITHVKLLKPRISIIRNADGTLNFSDLLIKKAEPNPGSQPEEKKSAFSLLVSKAQIVEGEVLFKDLSEAQQSLEIKKINLAVMGISLISPFKAKFSCTLAHKLGKGSVEFTGKFDLNKEEIEIEKFIPCWEEEFSILIKGKIRGFKQPELEILIREKAIPLEKLPQTIALPEDLEISGSPALKVELKGKIDELGISGKIDLQNVAIKYGQLFKKPKGTSCSMRKNLLIKQLDSLKVNSLMASLGYLSLSAIGEINELKAGSPELSLSLNTLNQNPKIKEKERISLDELSEFIPLLAEMKLRGNLGLSAGLKGNIANLKLKGVSSWDSIGVNKAPFWIEGCAGELRFSISQTIPPMNGVALTGKMKIKKAGFDQLEATNIQADISMAKSKLTVKSFSLSAYKGKLAGEAKANIANFKNIRFSLKGNLKDLDINQPISVMKPALSEMVYGKFSADADFKGSSRNIIKSLRGTGNLLLSDAIIKNIPLVNKLAAIVKTPSLSELNARRISSTINISRGKATTDNFLLDADKLSATGKGWFNMPDQRLDFSLQVKFAPEYSRGELARYTADENGRVTLDFKVTGTAAKPKYRIETTRVMKRAMKKEGKKLLEKGLKKLFR